MKKGIALLMTLCLLLPLTLALLPCAAQAEAYGTMARDSTIRSGPGDQFGVLEDLYVSRGDRVTIRTKHVSNGETWLQIEFIFWGRSPVRGYVRSADVNAELRRVPVEAPLCTGTYISQHTNASTGPADQGYLSYIHEIRPYTSAIIFEVDDGYAHIEYWSFAKGEKWRSWVPLGDMTTDWYFSHSGYYGVAELDSTLYSPTPTNAPSTYYGSTGRGYPVGVMCTVVSGSCHVKRGAGTDYPTVEYAYVGQRYEVLECKRGSTGKDWYRIRINGAYGWISSGLVSLDD